MDALRRVCRAVLKLQGKHLTYMLRNRGEIPSTLSSRRRRESCSTL